MTAKQATVIGSVLGVLIIVATFVLVTLIFGPGSAPANVANGIPAPNKQCRTDIEDLSNPWITDGWWAGYINGEVRQMTSTQAMMLSMNGVELDGVWLCPPKSDW